MTEAEDRLRGLKTLADKKRSEYQSAVARAKALKEVYDRSLSQLTETYQMATIEEAKALLAAKEKEISEQQDALEQALR